MMMIVVMKLTTISFGSISFLFNRGYSSPAVVQGQRPLAAGAGAEQNCRGISPP